MKICKRAVFFLVIVSIVGCHKSQEKSDRAAQEIAMPEMSKDFFVPSAIWTAVGGADSAKAFRQATSFVFAPLTVRLQEKTEGLLISPLIKLNFPKGGGWIDFANYVKLDRGTFKVFFEFEGMEHPESLSIYFISKSKKRKIGGEIFGSGCDVFFDVKNYVTAQNQGDGLVVNVTRDRHDSALGGNFIFSYKDDRRVLISSAAFTDSKRPDLFCEEKHQ